MEYMQLQEDRCWLGHMQLNMESHLIGGRFPFFSHPSPNLFGLHRRALHLSRTSKTNNPWSWYLFSCEAQCICTYQSHVVPYRIVVASIPWAILKLCCCPHLARTELKTGWRSELSGSWLKRQVVRPMRNSLQVRECAEEVSYFGGSPIAATDLWEF